MATKRSSRVLRPLRILPQWVPEIVTLRLCTVTFGMVGTATAAVRLIVKGQNESKVLMDLWWQYAGTAGGGLFGLFLLAWLTPNIPARGAALGVLLSVLVLAWGTFARGIEHPQWRWLECPLHANVVGIAGTCVILAIGGIYWAGVRAGVITVNPRFAVANRRRSSFKT